MKLTLLPHQRVFFTSDTHYQHANICRGTSKWGSGSKTRDFETLSEMNETMIKNINCLVREDDVLFHLGDWSFGGYDNISEFRQQIRCKNIHLLLGNHDHHIERNAGGIQRLFNSVHNYLKVEIVIPNQPSSENQRTQIRKTFVLCHYPIASWHDMNRGVIHLHGHVHLSDEHKLHAGKAMDVGMDGNSMNPYSLQEISQIMRDRPVRCIELPNDHHETNGGQ